MNRSFSKIRHIQEANKKLEERRISVLTEQVDISKYPGSKTDVEKVGFEDETGMGNIKITRDDYEVEKQVMKPDNPNYKKIKEFFEEKYPELSINTIAEPINKSVQPLVYEVRFVSRNSNYSYIPLEIKIEDIESNTIKAIDNAIKVLKPNILIKKPSQTFGL